MAVADRKKAVDLVNKANHEVANRNLPKAEKLLREAVQEDAAYVKAHRLLGDVLFFERKFGAAYDEYAATLKFDEAQRSLGESEKHAVTNQLGVSAAFAGNLAKAKEVFADAVKGDPEYPIYRYNLACTYAEMGELDTALVHLKDAWARRANLGEGERFPNPREDSSFKKYANDPRFQDAVRNMVF